MKRYAHIVGTGSCSPDKALTNLNLEKMIDTSDEWITARTGIKRSRIAEKEETSSDLATEASERAIAAAGVRYINMAGPEVCKHVVKVMEDAGEKVPERTGFGPSDIDLLIPHQANTRIVESTARKLGFPPEKVYINVHEYGNTSAASIPIVLDEAVRTGRIKKGDEVLLVTFGAGFTWGAAIVEF